MIHRSYTLRSRHRWPAMLLAGICAFTFGADTAMAGNLLLNSAFKLATNGVTPDYWDLHHAAALRFRNLYEQYNLVDTPAPPVAGAGVLRIVNSEADFPYLYLLSRIRESKWPAGDYVFSVYVKADRAGSRIRLATGWDRIDQGIDLSVTTQWQRYAAHFRIDNPDKSPVSPLIALPSRGSYWISAPRFESGDRMTAYAPAAEDEYLGTESDAQRRSAAATMSAIDDAATVAAPAKIAARFEFSSYSDESQARLMVSSTLNSAWSGSVACMRRIPQADHTPFFSFTIQLNGAQSRIVDVPITDLATGEYNCSVSGAGQLATAGLEILTPSTMTVRLNQFRRTLEINKSGFHIRGVMVGSAVPPEWYFSDIVEQGINTLLFFPGEAAQDSLDFAALDRVIALAAKYDVKLIIGPSVMGQKDAIWRPHLDRYAELIRRYRQSPVIIGWFVVDEPQAGSLRDHELIDIYTAVKAIDPYRLVITNWNSDDVPTKIAMEPHGSLAASDLYSIDYYPFMNDKTDLETFTLRTIRELRTAALAGRPGHSWLQLYGYLDATREPTGIELNYMSYVNLLYAGNYSYWQAKSNAKPTWDRIGETNREIDTLTKLLMLNPAATETKAPTIAGRYLYGIWRADKHYYLIVVHIGRHTESCALNLTGLFDRDVSKIQSYFDKADLDISDSMLRDTFGAFATRVYEIN